MLSLNLVVLRPDQGLLQRYNVVFYLFVSNITLCVVLLIMRYQPSAYFAANASITALTVRGLIQNRTGWSHTDRIIKRLLL